MLTLIAIIPACVGMIIDVRGQRARPWCAFPRELPGGPGGLLARHADTLAHAVARMRQDDAPSSQLRAAAGFRASALVLIHLHMW